MNDDSLLRKPHSVRQLALGMAAYSSASVFGPLVLFIFLGIFLDKRFNTSPIFLLLSVAAAFLLTNFLLFKKVRLLIRKFNELDEKKKSATADVKSVNQL